MIEVVTRREDRSGYQSFCCETKNSLEVASAGTENYAHARTLHMRACVRLRPSMLERMAPAGAGSSGPYGTLATGKQMVGADWGGRSFPTGMGVLT